MGEASLDQDPTFTHSFWFGSEKNGVYQPILALHIGSSSQVAQQLQQ